MRSIIVIDWRGYRPRPYDRDKHAPCEACGYRIEFWTDSHPASCQRRATAQGEHRG